MRIDYDEIKREKTLAERGLDFERAPEVLADAVLTKTDRRRQYGEDRMISIGLLEGRWVVVVWTLRGEVCRVISMRYANEREIKSYTRDLG